MKRKSCFMILVPLFTLLIAFLSCATTSNSNENISNTTTQKGKVEEPSREATKRSAVIPSLVGKGCVEGNCENGEGVYKYSTGEKYEGLFSDGLPDGNGVMSYANGDVYTGTFRKGKRHGHSIYKFKNGDQYSGEFYEGKMRGLGNYVWTDGNSLKGDFDDNGASGKGSYILKKSKSLHKKGRSCQINNRNVTCRN